MKLFLRRILQGRTPGLLVLALALLGLLLLDGPVPVARACWNIELIECFDGLPTAWPWTTPGVNHRWRWCTSTNGGATFTCWPNQTPAPRWGIISGRYFDVHQCQNDDQSAWCMGLPASNDPEFNVYPANFDTYMTWGPISLTTAVAARYSFWLLNRSEVIHDSIYWGASTNIPLNPQNMYMSGSVSGTVGSDPWQIKVVDLSDVTSVATGDSVSLLGQQTVYLFWRFKSNTNVNPPNMRYFGPMVDNVTMVWDDGGVNVQASGLMAWRPLDGDTVMLVEPHVGDTVLSTFNYRTCAGGIGFYPDFHIRGSVNDTLVLLDTLITGALESADVQLWLDRFVVPAPGEYTIRVQVDADGEVEEMDEEDNDATYWFNAPEPNYPPSFTWVNPGPDEPLQGDASVMLRWNVSDPLEQAMVMIYADMDTFTCNGTLISSVRQELDGPDSLTWDIHTRPENTPMWVYARLIDGANDICVYSPQPVVRMRAGATERPLGSIPDHFFLDQNYPNPFNPVTEIRYGVARGGAVTLRVYDMLGRLVSEPVNGDRAPGTYAVSFDASSLSTGLYFYTLTSPEGTASHKMMLMK